MGYARFILIVAGVLALPGCKLSDSSASACAATDVLVSAVNVSIDGQGFFAFEVANETLYGREGDFCVNQSGYLINGAGHYVLGFEPIGSGAVFNTGALERIALAPTNGSGGLLSDVQISAAGVVEGVYTPGGNVIAAKVGLATFTASQNLQTVNTVMCRETVASGGALIGEPATGVFGNIQAGLEGSYACEQGRFDLQVLGQGYFALNNAGTMHYDAGIILGVDRDGYYVDNHGYRVTGYAVDAGGSIVPARVDLSAVTTEVAPIATSSMTLDANLDPGAGQPVNGTFDKDQTDSYNEVVEVTVYDSLGQAHTAALYFVKTAVADIWHLYAYFDDTLMRVGGAAFQVVTFAGGALSSSASIGYDAVMLTNGAESQAITLDVTALTQAGAAFVVNAIVQDGYPVGAVTTTHIAANGEIRLDLSNGRSGVLYAQLLLAKFAGAGELDPSGDAETYVQSAASGAPVLDVPGASGVGVISATAR
ncbi:MAG: flagellar hook-basal body complex protein [Gammaproteobacteria bacterium]|nr:flagellar hook-basal body complex protein [Gammaproteobacteria bacterium]